MLGDITAAGELYIVTGYTDMRKSIDGLCAIVEDQLHMLHRYDSHFYSSPFVFPPPRSSRTPAVSGTWEIRSPGVWFIKLWAQTHAGILYRKESKFARTFLEKVRKSLPLGEGGRAQP